MNIANFLQAILQNNGLEGMIMELAKLLEQIIADVEALTKQVNPPTTPKEEGK